MDRSQAPEPNRRSRSGYRPPLVSKSIKLHDLIHFTGRIVDEHQESLFRGTTGIDLDVHYAGDLGLLRRKCVSVIGARDVTEDGARRARSVSRKLADAGVVVTSGLAKGVDINAHRSALEEGGSTIAVIGTPIDKVYPAEHSVDQMEIYSNHLLLSQFRSGQRTFPSDFPKRNKLMAALTDASIIVEASDSSGTLHQASECVRLNRWLFIMRSVADDTRLDWPRKFLGYERCVRLEDVRQVLEAIQA